MKTKYMGLWAETMDIDDGPDEKVCLRCCVRWLNEEADR